MKMSGALSDMSGRTPGDPTQIKWFQRMLPFRAALGPLLGEMLARKITDDGRCKSPGCRVAGFLLEDMAFIRTDLAQLSPTFDQRAVGEIANASRLIEMAPPIASPTRNTHSEDD